MRAAAGAESGYSLIEVLTTMAILSTVLGGLTGLFVAGMRSELDANARFQAQQNAGLALSKLRRDVHCGSVATATSTAVTLTLPASCTSGAGSVAWCTVGSGQRFALYRKAGATCDATGVRHADYLTSGTAFTYVPQTVDSRAKLSVVFPVDVDPSDARAAYELQDGIVLRNSTRT